MSNRLPALAVFAALPLLSSCSADAVTSSGPVRPQAIVFGFVDDGNAYPNVGAFIVQRPSDGQIFPICSGTLISPTAFLTAAHCTLDYLISLAPLGFTAAVSFSSPIGWGDQTDRRTKLIEVTQVITNPRYNQSQSDAGDLGVLVLPERGTRGITPAALPRAGLLDQLAAQGSLQTASFTAVGYGVQDRVVGGGTPFFQDTNPIPRMYAFSSFNALNPGYLRLSQNPATGNGGTCYGDSGGPNFLEVAGVRTLVAATVTGDIACRSTSVVYRLDTASARAFLAAFVTLP